MGIYSDIQKEIGEAFDDVEELNDAVINFNVVQFGSTTYVTDGDSSNNENIKPCRGTVILDTVGEILDAPTNLAGKQILILDSEKPFAFEIDMKIITDFGEFKISGISTDPAKATWIISCRIWS